MQERATSSFPRGPRPQWGGQPYAPVGRFYRERFGERVQVVPVTIASTCPNRLGLKGMRTCSFCDVWGSSAYPELQGTPLEQQIGAKIRSLGARYRSSSFLVYFQAYTSTFLAVRKLRESFETALRFPGVRGLIVGTRPDCLSPAVMELWQEFHERSFLSVELGVQTFHNGQLEFLRRGHTAEQSLEAIHRIAESTTVDLGIHLMFGLPGETDEQMRLTGELVSRLPLQQVKLHNLHVLKHTELERWYHEGRFQPAELPTYAARVITFLRHLSPDTHVQRLVALSSRWEELVAPEWTRFKMQGSQFIVDRMRALGAYQGERVGSEAEADESTLLGRINDLGVAGSLIPG